MTDIATATPEQPIVTAPVTTTDAAAPAASQEQAVEQPQQDLLSKRDARSGLRDFARQMRERLSTPKEETPAAAAPAAVATSADPSAAAPGQPRGADGKFAPKDGAAVPEAPAASQPASPGATPEAPPAAAQQPHQIRVPIDPKHPIAHQGLAAFTVATEAEANALRAVLNGTYTRRVDAEQAAARAEQAEDRVLRLEAERDAEKKWRGTPEYSTALTKYHDLVDSHGQDVADRFWASFVQDLSKMSDQEYAARANAAKEQRAQQAVDAWKREAYAVHHTRLPREITSLPEYGDWFDRAYKAFDLEATSGAFDHVKTHEGLHDEFRKFFARRLAGEPKVGDVMTRLQGQPRTPAPAPAIAPTPPAPAAPTRTPEQIAADAVEQYKRDLATSRRTSPPHPMAGPGAGAARVGDGGAAAGQAAAAREEMTPGQLKRALQAESRDLGRRIFSRPNP